MKFTKRIICISLIVFCTLFISACGKDNNETKKEPTEQERIYELYVSNIEAKGDTPLSYKDWLATIKGEDGKTPVISIGSNNHWYINGVDTGVNATGGNGKTPTVTIGNNDNWFIDGVDSGVNAQPNSILSIEKTSSDDNVDTYTITYSNGTYSTFTVTNAKEDNFSIDEVSKYLVKIHAKTGEYGYEDEEFYNIDSLNHGFIYKEDDSYLYIYGKGFYKEEGNYHDVTISFDDTRYDAEYAFNGLYPLKVNKISLTGVTYNIPKTSTNIKIGQKVYILTDKNEYVVSFINKIDDKYFMITTSEGLEDGALVFDDNNALIGAYDYNGRFEKYEYIDKKFEYIIENKEYYYEDNMDINVPRISSNEILDKMENDERFIVVMGSYDCRHCITYSTIINRYISDNPDREIYYYDLNNPNKFNVESHSEIVRLIDAIENRDADGLSSPTTFIVHDGYIVDAFSGAMGFNAKEYIEVCNFLDGKYIGKDLFTMEEDYGIEDENSVYKEALSVVVNKALETTKDIQTAYDMVLEKFEEEVKVYANYNVVSIQQARNALLEREGYLTMEEMKEDILREIKTMTLTEKYYEEVQAEYYDKFIEERLPYLVSHVHIRTSRNTNTPYFTSIDSSDAKAIYDTIKMFEEGESFANVALEMSEDSGSNTTGGSYYFDKTYVSKFVDEFAYGVLLFDTYMSKNQDGSYTFGLDRSKLEKVIGVSSNEDIENYYKNGFNFIDMNVVNYLGNYYDNTRDYLQIRKYEKNGDDYINVGNAGYTNNFYVKNIIFNRAFNKPGISVIGYSSLDEIPSGVTNYVELKNGNDSKYILTDEKGNPLFMVVAQGSSSDYWIHFMKIDVSSLSNPEEAKLFFSIDKEKRIMKMVEEKRTVLQQDGITDKVELENQLREYMVTLKNYKTYVELNAETQSEIEIKKLELKTQILLNAINGECAGYGCENGNKLLIQYDAFYHYLEEYSVSLNSDIKDSVDLYITNERVKSKNSLTLLLNEMLDKHTTKLNTANSEEYLREIIPYECMYKSGVTSSAMPECRYIVGEGYEVKLKYIVNNLGELESRWYKIDSSNSKIILPTPISEKEYGFLGWYKDTSFTQEISKDSQGNYYIDLSESRITNTTTFYAKIVKPQNLIISIDVGDRNLEFTFEKLFSFSLENPMNSIEDFNNINIDLGVGSKEGETFKEWQINGQTVTVIDSNFIANAFNSAQYVEDKGIYKEYKHGEDIFVSTSLDTCVIMINLTAIFE